MPAATSLRIAHCPLHGPSWTRKTGRKIVGLGADSAGVTEAYKGIGWLSRRPLYRCVTGPKSRIDSRGRPVAHDVAIVVRRAHKILEAKAVKVADELSIPPDGIKWHPERWLVWVVYQTKSGFTVAHFMLHPQPGPTKNERVAAEYARHMDRFEAEAKRIKGQYPGVVVIATGDMQLGAGGAKPWTPSHVFDRAGLVAENDKIDWVAHSPNVVKALGRMIPARDVGPGHDHPWMIRTLTRKG